MAGNKRFTVLRKVKLVPAALMSIIILAVLSLLGLLNFTPPSLDDSSSDASQEASEEVETETDQQALVSMDLNRPPAEIESDDEEEKAVQPLDLVDVLIDGDSYWFGVGLREGKVVRQQKTVGEIVIATQQSEGDASGVKIRVTRTFDATAQAERTLIEALSDAGLSDDEIDQRRTLVERPSDSELAK